MKLFYFLSNVDLLDAKSIGLELSPIYNKTDRFFGTKTNPKWKINKCFLYNPIFLIIPNFLYVKSQKVSTLQYS